MSTVETGGAQAAEPSETAEAVAAAETSAAAEPLTAGASAGAEFEEPVEETDDVPAHAKSAKDEFVEIAKTIFYALLIALVLRILFFQPYTIPSASMEPNLYEGDYIIVSKWNYGYSRHSIPFSPPLFHGRTPGKGPARGDIVVFKLPSDNKSDYIKRVVGLPGDRIQMRDNHLYINDAPVKDEVMGPIEVPTFYGVPREATEIRETFPEGKNFTTQDFGPGGDLDNTDVYVVPEGYYFMMGDNRDNSIDSRVDPRFNGGAGVGFVPAENLVGKAQIILFSWHPGASLFKPWTWFTKVRPSRFFTPLK
ncbi:signal peptidase I [Caulobacter sp. 17J80-11]|uniref:signal peptidase I n=1 Tax=Caulobacter sp. 17J80-11 TaxID=2763502 RepID=UPI0016535A73|nr:signal peptidase I [Caulobacter sp. 17J80-11]MBC6980693.1 signal peptidase I [Caulobacter sp. 17J80-11]